MKMRMLNYETERWDIRDLTRKESVYVGMLGQVSELSKDANTHVGAMIVGGDGSIISMGYNGAPMGASDGMIPHSREMVSLTLSCDYDDVLPGAVHVWEDNKYPYMVHAETNAIMFARESRADLRRSEIWVTHLPCPNCAKTIAQAGIGKVCAILNHAASNSSLQQSLYIFEACGISIRFVEP